MVNTKICQSYLQFTLVFLYIALILWESDGKDYIYPSKSTKLAYTLTIYATERFGKSTKE